MTIIVRSNEPKQAAAQAEVQASTESAATQESIEHAESAPEARATEQEVSSESGTEESESHEEETKEGEENHQEESDKSNEDGKGKKKGGFQRRIDKLNKRVNEKEQEVEYWKQQALKSAGDSKQDPKIETKKASQEGKPDPNKFESHADYVEALTEWKTEQKLKEHEQKREQSKLLSEQQKVAQRHAERVKAFAEKHEDFEEVLSNVDDIPQSPALREIIVSSKNGPELLYELAKNPDEARRIAMLPPLAVAREIGKIESRLASKDSAGKENQTKKITNAPKPLNPVNAGGKGTVSKTLEQVSKGSQAEYEAFRREQMKRRRA